MPDENLSRFESDAPQVNPEEQANDNREASDKKEIANELDGVTTDSQARVLDVAKINGPKLELLAQMKDQVENALQAAAFFEINEDNGDAPLPSRDQIMGSIQDQLSPSQAIEILKLKEPPQLVIYPIASANRYQNALSGDEWVDNFQGSHRLNSLFLDLRAKEDGAEGDEVVKWGFAITGGVLLMEVPDWDDLTEENCAARIELFNKRYKDQGIERLDCGGFASLMMQILLRDNSDSFEGINIGQGYILKGEKDFNGDTLVASGNWDYRGGKFEVQIREQHLQGRVLSFSEGEDLFRPAALGTISN